jgi:V8-like Glu-specific endopeptidase
MVDAVPAAGSAVPNRTYPYNGVVYVAVTMPDGSVWDASGVLIAPDEVLTAAHVVWHQGVGQAIQAFVQPAVNGADVPYLPVGVANVHYFAINDPNDQFTGAESQHDFALLHLSQPVSAGVMPLEPNFPGGQIHVTGYPGGGYTMADLVTNAYRASDVSDLVYSGQQSLGPGTSGGPLWHIGANGQPYCVGVVSSQSVSTPDRGLGGEITPEILNSVRVWEAQDHGGVSAPDPNSPTPLSGAEVSVMAGLTWPQRAAMAFLDNGSHLGADFTALGSALSAGQDAAPFVGHANQDMMQLLAAYTAAMPGIGSGVTGPSGTPLAIPGQFVVDVINAGLNAEASGSASLDQAYGGALSRFFGGAGSAFMGHAVA